MRDDDIKRAEAGTLTARDSAVFGVPHVLFEQGAASSLCNCETAATLRRQETERAKPAGDFRRNRGRLALRIGGRLHRAQPVEILRRKARIGGCHRSKLCRLAKREEGIMALKVSKADVWADTIDDRAGGGADKLETPSKAGAKLEVLLAR